MAFLCIEQNVVVFLRIKRDIRFQVYPAIFTLCVDIWDFFPDIYHSIVQQQFVSPFQKRHYQIDGREVVGIHIPVHSDLPIVVNLFVNGVHSRFFREILLRTDYCSFAPITAFQAALLLDSCYYILAVVS